jgi:ubiquitin-conjugating enzyme E2 I
MIQKADQNLNHRKQWRKDHPFGFVAKPVKSPSGGIDLKKWDCAVPGKENTIWEGGLFKIEVTFPDGKKAPPLSPLCVTTLPNYPEPCPAPFCYFFHIL